VVDEYKACLLRPGRRNPRGLLIFETAEQTCLSDIPHVNVGPAHCM